MMAATKCRLPDPTKNGRTKAAPAAETDINQIVARFLKTGRMPEARTTEMVYADVSNAGDFQALQNKLVVARKLFDLLSHADKMKFQNSPEVFINWMAMEQAKKAAVPPKEEVKDEAGKAAPGVLPAGSASGDGSGAKPAA